MKKIASIVEGHAEVESISLLMRRVMHEKLEVYEVEAAKPFRVPKGKITKVEELKKAIGTVIRSREDVGGVLVIVDADDDQPAALAKSIKEAGEGATGLPVRAVVASRELEAWFLGAKKSLRGVRGIKEDALPPEEPETIRGAKERLQANMIPGSDYYEVDDQPAMAVKMSLEEAWLNCPSFRCFVESIQELLVIIKSTE